MSATNQAEQTALTLPQRAAVALGESANEAKLRELVSKSAGIIAVTNADGREEAHRAGMVLLKTRTGIEKTGKTAREDAQAFSKAVIAMEKDLIGIIQPEETRVLGLRDAWDEKIAAEKAAKIAAERARVEAIHADIDGIVDLTLGLDGAKPAAIKSAMDSLDEIVVDEARFAEFTEAAAKAISNCRARLTTLHDGAIAHEQAMIAAEEARKAEAARLEAERAELAKLRAEQIERERIAKVESDRIAAEQAAEAKRLADMKSAQEAEQRRIAEQAAANLRQEREAQELAMRLEREAAVKAQAEAEAAQAEAAAKMKAAQEAFEAQKAEFAAAIQKGADHAEAIEMNAALDTVKPRLAEIEVPTFTQPDDLTRCNAMVATARADAEAQSLSAYHDAGLDCPELTNEDIIEFGAEMGLPLAELVTRLEAFTVYARENLMVAA